MDENFGISALAKDGISRRIPKCFFVVTYKQAMAGSYVCLSLSDGGLRVWGEGSEQNLRHVLLAKGHQEQRQALIGGVHTATLIQRKRRGDAFSNKNNFETRHGGGDV